MLPKVFIVEDDELYATAIAKSLEGENCELRIFHTGRDFLDSLSEVPDIVSLDHSLPDVSGMSLLKKLRAEYPQIETIVLSGQEDVNIVVEAYENGARNYIVKNENSIIQLRNAIRNIIAKLELQQEVALLKEELQDRSKYSKIIGESPAILKVLKLIQRVEKTDTLTMITGDSGTGKELVAEAIHTHSSRRKKPFVVVNVAAIPTHLLEDELFGHERGAFTGASSKRKGKFEEADGGTIFLDEIGELELNLQTKLLRVLQDEKISRLGSNKLIKLDLRIIAATNKNLGELVKQRKFREDLYYRIQGFLIHLPKLRERGKDILLLADYFIEQSCSRYKVALKHFDKGAQEALLKHHWTGNVRELIALVDRCVLMSDGDAVSRRDLVFSGAI